MAGESIPKVFELPGGGILSYEQLVPSSWGSFQRKRLAGPYKESQERKAVDWADALKGFDYIDNFAGETSQNWFAGMTQGQIMRFKGAPVNRNPEHSAGSHHEFGWLALSEMGFWHAAALRAKERLMHELPVVELGYMMSTVGIEQEVFTETVDQLAGAPIDWDYIQDYGPPPAGHKTRGNNLLFFYGHETTAKIYPNCPSKLLGTSVKLETYMDPHPIPLGYEVINK